MRMYSTVSCGSYIQEEDVKLRTKHPLVNTHILRHRQPAFVQFFCDPTAKGYINMLNRYWVM